MYDHAFTCLFEQLPRDVVLIDPVDHPLGRFHVSEFYHDEQKFASIMHAYEHDKAYFFGNAKQAAMIAAETTVYGDRVKRIVGRLPFYDANRWRLQCYEGKL